MPIIETQPLPQWNTKREQDGHLLLWGRQHRPLCPQCFSAVRTGPVLATRYSTTVVGTGCTHTSSTCSSSGGRTGRGSLTTRRRIRPVTSAIMKWLALTSTTGTSHGSRAEMENSSAFCVRRGNRCLDHQEGKSSSVDQL